MSKSDSCENCRFLHQIKHPQHIGQKLSICRRSPPLAQGAIQQTGAGLNVMVMPAVFTMLPGPPADVWCGEHEPEKPALAIVP